MEISRLAKRNKYKYPGYKLIDQVKVATPIYRIPLDIVIQKRKKLSIIQEFCLKLIKENIKDTKAIAELLGMEKRVIDNNVSELIAHDIVRYNLLTGISLTEKGEITAKNLELEVPVNLNYTFNIDALTGKIVLDDKKLNSHKDIQRDNLRSIHVLKERPTLDSLKFKDVRDAIRRYNSNINKLTDELDGDLLSINDMDEIYVQYKHIDLLVFHKEEDDSIKILPFEKNDLIEEYEGLIDIDLVKTIILEKKEEVAVEAESMINTIDNELIDNVKKSVIEYEKLEEELILGKEKAETMTLDSTENISKDELEKLKERILLLENELSKLSKNRIVHTYEHRELLIDALTNAQDFVIIISPWIKRSAFDKELEELIYNALNKKVKVVIGYGISNEEDGCDSNIINRLMKLSIKNDKFKLVNLPSVAYNTHEKVLICDHKFMVITSFNWLSFAGNPKWGLRQETGYYIEQKNSIDDMIKNVCKRMKLKVIH